MTTTLTFGPTPAPAHIWAWSKRLPERKGQPCRIVETFGTRNLMRLQFEDGTQVFAPRGAIRRAAR